MIPTTFFTTLSAKNWQEYGQYTIPTWEKLCEKVVIFVDAPARVVMSDFFQRNSPWVRPEYIGSDAINFHRELSEEAKASCYLSGEYNYRFDIVKFSWPIFAFIRALSTIKTRSVWLDADVAVRGIDGIMDCIFQKGAEVSFLGRNEFPREHPYTETGLLAFNLERKKAKLLADVMAEFLKEGIIYTLPQWHDCIVFDEARKILSDQISFKSISKDESVNHVFDETLGEWMTHLRGDRKVLAAYGNKFLNYLIEQEKK